MTNLQLSSQFTSSRNPPPDSARRTFWLRSCVTVLSGVLLSCGTASEGHSTAEETGHTQDDLVLCPLNCDDNNPCTQDQCVFRLVGSSLQPTCSHSSVAAGTSCSLAGSSCQDTCSADGLCLPQGSTTPLDRTVPSTVESVSSFLRSCSLQAPLTAQSMTATRGISLLRGLVRDQSAKVISGVTISVLGDTGATPEHGHTTTRADGRFDFRVLGGRSLTLNFAKAGYMPVQRRVDVPADGYLTVEEVVLRPRSAATNVALNSASWQWAAGEKMTDSRGARTGKVLFPAGTQATFGAPDRPSPVPGPLPTSMSVRLTEYTSGDTGQRSMPGSLPGASAFTYAIDLSVDGYENSQVSFSKPVAVYVDSFIGVPGRGDMPVGTVVPVGVYDRSSGSWKASDNGRVIQILSVSGGMATVDVDGDGLADATSARDGLGYIPDDEKRALAAAGYAAGTRLWRVPVQHFSTWDFNWPFGPCPTCKWPGLLEAAKAFFLPNGCSTKRGGSIIECENQTLGEQIPVQGTPFGLRYSSERVPGRLDNKTVRINLGDGKQSPPPAAVHFEADIAGQHVAQDFDYSTIASVSPYTFAWNGLDGMGRQVQGAQTARFRVGYEYPGTYYTSKSAFEKAFGAAAGEADDGQSAAIVNAPGGPKVTLWQSWTTVLGALDARPLGFGGWTLTHQHQLDPLTRRLYRGDGVTLEANLLGATLTRLTPGLDPPSQNYLPTLDGYVSSLGSVAVLNDGCVVVPSTYQAASATILAKLCAGKDPVRLAGTTPGAGGSHNDGSGNPLLATFASQIPALTISPDGRTLLIAEHTGFSGCDWHIRRMQMAADGSWSIDTIAGAGNQTTCVIGGDNGLLTAATFKSINALAFGYDGSFYIRDDATVRRVSPGGKITRIGGLTTGSAITPVDGEVATKTPLDSQSLSRNLGVDAAGRVYVTSPVNSSGMSLGVFRIDLDGRIHRIAGGGSKGNNLADGLNATEADFGNFVHAMAVDAAGRVVLAHSPVPTTDSTGKSFSEPLRLIEPNGVIQTISPASPIDPARPLVTSELAYAAAISQPTALAWGPGGSISLLDSKGAVRQITTTGPGLSSGVALDQLAVVDPGGTEIYVFTTDGRHVKTVDALTGVLLWQFGYSGGSLSQITDRDNRVTLITRTDANVILTSPGGQQTKLSFDAAKGGWLSGVEYPGASLMPYPYTGGVKFVPEHDGQGLLLHFTDPRGKKSDFEYDPLTGRLTKDSDAAGGTQTLSIDPASSNTSWQVNIKTAENRVTNHAVAIDLHGTRVRKTTSWDGSVTTTTEPSDGSMTVSSPTGGLSATRGADPLFGTAVPLLKSVTAAPTAALTSTLTVDTTASAAGSSLLGGQNRTQTVTFGGGSWKIDYAKAGADQLTLTGPTLKNDPQVVIKAHHNDQGRIDKITLPWASKQITVGYHTSPPAIAGRVHTISQGSRVLTLGYDTASGFLTTIQDALLQTTTLTSDGLGRPRVVTAPGLTDTLKMTPNQNGALVSLSPPSKPAHSFDYDGKGRPTTYNPPPVASVPTTTETTGYSLDGFPLSLNLPGTSDNTIGLDYLDQKRLSRVNYPNNSSVTVTYDDTGTATRQLKSLTGPGSESLTFGWAGSLLTDITTQQGRKIVWTDFDAALRPQTEKLDGSPVATVYDNDGFPLTTTSSATLTGMVADGPSLTHSRAATPGLVASATFTVGSTTLGESFGYDPDFGEPSSYSISRSGQNLYKVEILQRDLLGRIVVRRETIGAGTGAEVVARRYEYDAAGRLTRERACTNPSDNTCAASTQAHSWSFDDNGNRLTSDSATSTYDAQDRLLPAPGVLEQTYTPDGRLQTKKVGTQTTTYTYDITGALVRVVPASGSTVDYKVDALGRRVERSAGGVVTRWVYGAGLGPVAEYSNGTLVARYVYARGRNVPDWAITAGGVYRFVTDERGSVRLVVRSDGAVVRRQDYDVWGVMTPPSPSDVNAPPQTFGFAGGMYDDTTKLVRFGARDYDPQLGRWTGKDSIRFDGGDTDLYSYSFNDPINYTDPYGTNPLVAVVISGGIGFAAGGIGSYLGQKASGGEIDGGDILIAALAGGANGALLPLFAEAGLASAVALGAASSALQYNATTVYHGRCPDALDMGGAALLGGALGFVSGAVAPYPTKMISGVRETKTLMADPLASRLNAKLGFEQVLGDSLFSGATTIGRAGIAGYWGNR